MSGVFARGRRHCDAISRLTLLLNAVDVYPRALECEWTESRLEGVCKYLRASISDSNTKHAITDATYHGLKRLFDFFFRRALLLGA